DNNEAGNVEEYFPSSSPCSLFIPISIGE
ncbi:hypothetical protein Tco_0036174, partial [Tanacetum coccineum]